MNATATPNEDHFQDIENICIKEFKVSPQKVERMKVGSANEVYSVRIRDDDFVLRLNKTPTPLQGSSKNIPLFKSLGIIVPAIIAENYTKDVTEYYYQIQTKLSGVDIDKVISFLKQEELSTIAEEIALIAKKLITLPTNGKYGYADITEAKLKNSWNEVLFEMLDIIKKRTSKTGVVDDRYIQVFERALDKYSEYLSNVQSQFYFDDMSSKNVLIGDGVFMGIVDLDGVAYGDYLEGIGRIKGSWYGTEYGDFYANVVMDSLDLSSYEREMVTLYALLNRIQWLSEIGIQFNQNTSTAIDKVKVSEYEVVIDGLISELNL